MTEPLDETDAIHLTAEEREQLLIAWPWPKEAATTADGFEQVVMVVRSIVAHRAGQPPQGGRTDVLRHKVGTCPACRGGLWAQVRVETMTAAPSLTDDGKAQAYARSHIRATDLDHHCDSTEVYE